MTDFKIAICDDIQEEIDIVEKYLKKILEDKKLTSDIHRFNSSEELLSEEISDFDLFILDVEMGKINGMDAAKEIRRRGIKSEIVFVTGFIEYIQEGYKVNAYRYILKPLKFDDIKECMDGCIEEMLNRKKRFIVISYKGAIEKINLDDINYIDVIKKSITVHTKERNISYSGNSIEKLEEELSKQRFFRCHKSYLVNMMKIEKIEKESLYVAGETIPLSRHRARDLKRAFTEMMGDIIC